MTYGKPDKGGRERKLPSWAIATAVLVTIPIVWLMMSAVDTGVLGAVWDSALADPLGSAMALAAFGAAFILRSVAWGRVLPDLDFGQGWAGIHVALLGNHVLPLRLGEPLRIASVVRRAGIDWPRATASTVTLRSADLVAIGLIGGVAGLGAFSAWWATAVVVVGGTVMVAAGVLWVLRLRAAKDISIPGPVAIGSTVAAWLLESLVVFQTARWAGVDLGFDGAVLVTAAAVIAQVAAFAPGGLGTYEAGGVAAMTTLGVEPAVGLAIVLSAHAVKTAYSLVAGLASVFVPAPGMFGRLRLANHGPDGGRQTLLTEDERPVVLFMPAHNEAASVRAVVERVPTEVVGRQVICLVVDDGSSDATASEANSGGARVIGLDHNHGVGAAVRVGLRESLRYHPAAVAFCDADGEYAPEELETLVRPILDGECDYVVGSRFDGEIGRMLPHRRFGNLVLTRMLSWVARRDISDGQSGYRAFSPRAAERAEVIHDFNYAQVLTLDLLAKGMRYMEVPISYSFRTTGQSFVKLGRYLKAVVPAVYREVNA